MGEDTGSRRRVAWSAYAVAGLFVIGLARFAVPGGEVSDGTVAGLVVAAAPHLVLLVGVWPRLTVPRWAHDAGFVWLALDLLSDVLALDGAEGFLVVRYVGHLFAALWIAAIAWRTDRATRVVGVLLAVLLGGYTLVAAWVPPIAQAPTAPLLVAWWALVGRRVADGRLATRAR